MREISVSVSPGGQACERGRELDLRGLGVRFEFFQLALHELQMNVQRIERVADFVRDAGGEQRERLHAFAFNGLECFLPRFGRVVQDERHPGTAGGLAIEGRGVEPQKTRTGIIHFKFVPGDACAARSVGARNFSQSTSGKRSAMGWPSTSGCKPMSRVTA